MAGFSLVHYLREIAALRGFELASDIVGWRASIATDGVVTYSTPPSPGSRRSLTKKHYDYFFHKMIVGGTIAADLDDYDQIRFNLQRDGASENIFQNDIEVAGLLAPQSGEPTPLDFSPGGFKLPGGADLDLTVTARASFTTARVLTVKLVAALVPKDFQLHGRV